MTQTSIIPKTLVFKEKAGTSRGIYTTRKVWYIVIKDTQLETIGIGECAPLPMLSCDDVANYESILQNICKSIDHNEGKFNPKDLTQYPSILFGLELASWHLKCNELALFNTPFAKGEYGIPINGLIWMGSFKEMTLRLEEKLKQGFTCIKLKVGAIDFDDELKLLHQLRQQFSSKEVIIRLDANGAFSPEEAYSKLSQLYKYDIHSIEQPIKAGQWEYMYKLIEKSPIDIALDEELIGINSIEEKYKLINQLKPHYIILKPSLHGGFYGSNEWIDIAKNAKIGYWITSALESNIGLNGIAQWAATLDINIPQGLGTGLLYTNNISGPLYIEKDKLFFNPQIKNFNLSELLV